LKAAGKSGATVKELAAKLGKGYDNISVWFHTTGKGIREIKKVEPGRFGGMRGLLVRFSPKSTSSIRGMASLSALNRRIPSHCFPGYYHHHAGGLSFADGHSEIRRWVDPRTMSPIRVGQTTWQNNTPTKQPGNTDILWLQERATRQQ
jgi:hypothetical protein